MAFFLGAYISPNTQKANTTPHHHPEHLIGSVSLKKWSGKIVVSHALFIYQCACGHMMMCPSTRFADLSGGVQSLWSTGVPGSWCVGKQN